MLGVATVALRAAGCTWPKPAAEPISRWEFDEVSSAEGVFEDRGPAHVLLVHVGTWADLTTGSLVDGAGGTSAFTDGSAYATMAANRPAHDLAALTISFYYQRASAAEKQILLAAGNGSEAGDFSVEVFANGRLRAWHTGQDGVRRYFENTNGITGTDLQVGTAYRIDLSLGSQGARIYLDGAELVAARIPENLNGWNNTRVKYLGRWIDGVQAPAVGVFDRLRIWNRQLTGAELAELEPAQSITLPGQPAPPPVTFSCLLRSSGGLFAGHANLGTIDGQADLLILNQGGNARYDFRGTVREIRLINPPNDLTWAGVRNLICCDGNNGAASHNGACVSGGAIICPNMDTDYNWNPLYQSSNNPRPAILIRETAAVNMLFEGFRSHAGGWDVVGFGSGTRNTCENITLHKFAVTMQRDDAIENDNWIDNVVVDNCYIESFVLFSCRNTGFNGSARTNTVQNTLAYCLPCRIDGNPKRLGPFFKVNSNSVRFRIINSIFAVPDATPQSSNAVFGNLIANNKLHPDSQGNTICWLGSGSFPFANPDPSRFTVLTGSAAQTFWNNALADWWATFPGHRFSFDPPAPTGGLSELITTPEDHGWDDGNTVAQNTAAFQDAIDAASAGAGSSSTGRGVVELMPSKTYTVAASGNGAVNDPTAALLSKSNVEIRTKGKPTGSTRAVIQAASWSGLSGIHNRVVLRVEDSHNFRLAHAIIDGNKNSIDEVTDIDYTKGQDGGLHCILYQGDGNSNIVFQHVVSRFALNDGLYIRQDSNTAAGSALFEDCVFTRNRRQGMSTVRLGSASGGWDQFVFRRCEFSDTGDFSGDVSGQKPGAGVDMEPAVTSGQQYGVTFDDCDFDGNLGSRWHHGQDTGVQSSGRGFVLDARANTEKLKLIDCRCTNNTDGLSLIARDAAEHADFRIENLVLSGNDGGNHLDIGCNGTAAGHFTDVVLINCDVSAYSFRSSMPDTGHSIIIWQGDHSPTVTTNGKQTITNNAGFP